MLLQKTKQDNWKDLWFAARITAFANLTLFLLDVLLFRRKPDAFT